MPDSTVQFPFFKRVVQTPSIEFLIDMVSVAQKEIIIVSPWIKQNTLQKIIDATRGNKNIKWLVLSRGNSKDFLEGFSDIEAFKLMIEHPSFELRTIKKLHAKIYVVDRKICLITSANLTEGGMEISHEMGLATIEKDEITAIESEIAEWFNNGKLLDAKWLKAEQKKILEHKEKKKRNQGASLAENDEASKRSHFGNPRNLNLPEDWAPLLDSLSKATPETKVFSLQFESLLPSFSAFFEYIRKLDDKRIQQFLIDWLVKNKSLRAIGKNKISPEGISQKIANRQIAGNIWLSEEGKKIKQQVDIFLENSIDTKNINVTDVLSSKNIESVGLSLLDIGYFIQGMLQNNIVNGHYHVKATQSNQFVVCDKETLNILKEIEHVFCADHYQFADIENFCKIGELDSVPELWFDARLNIFERLYMTHNKKIGCNTWSIQKVIAALARELVEESGLYYWHYSHMQNAIQYLFPDKYKKTDITQVGSRISQTPGLFQQAGSHGYWQLKAFGDGCRNNEEAVMSILREANNPMHKDEIVKKLENRNRIIEKPLSVHQLLDRMYKKGSITKYVGQGKYSMKNDMA